MRRVATFVVLLAGVIFVAVWIADRPGSVVIDWQGYRIESTIAGLALFMTLVFLIFAAVYGLWRQIKRGAKFLGGGRFASRRERGYRALSNGLVAIAAGDTVAAKRYAKQVEHLLSGQPLSRLLLAQTAQLDGKTEAAMQHYQAMMSDRKTAFLGIRGLLADAKRRGDQSHALELAHRAVELRPKSLWAWEGLFTLLVNSGNWQEASNILNGAVKKHFLSSAEERRRRAILSYCQALTARSKKNRAFLGVVIASLVKMGPTSTINR